MGSMVFTTLHDWRYTAVIGTQATETGANCDLIVNPSDTNCYAMPGGPWGDELAPASRTTSFLCRSAVSSRGGVYQSVLERCPCTCLRPVREVHLPTHNNCYSNHHAS